MSTNFPPFRTVRRGLDPEQVEATVRELMAALDAIRREAADRTVELAKAQAAHAELTGRLKAATAHVGELEEAHRTAASPTYRDLGERIASILSLADEEAQEVRGVATLEAQRHRDEADAAVAALRADSERYAEDVRTKAQADAARAVEEAKRSADTMLDHADRECAARREEAEALFESHRAKAAAAAADFETTLAERRDKAAAEFAALLSANEESLSSVQSRASQLAHESQAAHHEARSAASSTIESAKEEAALLVQQARAQADRIRRDSERELAAATSRRDSINAQLSNVRQMLATLGRSALAEHVAYPDEADTGVEAAQVDGDDASHDGLDATADGELPDGPDASSSVEKPTLELLSDDEAPGVDEDAESAHSR